MNRLIVILSILLLTCQAKARTDTPTACFAEEAKTLRIAVNGNDLLPPVIVAGTQDIIEISFDLLGEEYRYLRYDLLHCDAMWQPSGLIETEYMDGFNMADVRTGRKSSATTVTYYHYDIQIPNEDVRLKISGNYLLRVYDETDLTEPLLQCRFMVTEQSVGIAAGVSGVTDVSYNDRLQQLTVEVEAESGLNRDLMNDLLLTVTQNGQEYSRVAIDRPSYINGNKAVYDHRKELIFPGGNEYRRFETVATDFLPTHVAEIGFRRPYYHFVLETDYPWADGYVDAITPNGRYRVREFNSPDSDVEADYVWVKFSLDPVNGFDGEVFLDGDFTLRDIDGKSKMEYNGATGLYEKVLMLKQGSYSYRYITPGKTGNVIEGDFSSTRNEYLICLYLRTPGSRYDRLIATGVVKY